MGLFGRLYSKSLYSSVRQDDLDDYQEKRTAHSSPSSSFLSILWSPLPWMLCSLALFICLGVVTKASSSRNFTHEGSFERGFDTEFEPAKSTILTKKTKFSGTMKYTDEGHLYMDMSPENVRYFGEPSPEVDQAWADLIGPAMQFSMSREEAEALAVGTYEHPKDGFLVTPDVLHTLHCVNHVRKIIDSEYYFKVPLHRLPRKQRVHTDHCLNHIRQVVQCHMDLTPVTTMYFGSVNAEVGNFEQEHTCRDLKPLREWAKARKQADQSRLKALGEGGDGRVGHPGHEPLPTHGYVDNEDALLPWNSTLSEVA